MLRLYLLSVSITCIPASKEPNTDAKLTYFKKHVFMRGVDNFVQLEPRLAHRGRNLGAAYHDVDEHLQLS